MEVYQRQRRILTPANSNGFSPGEAGSAVLVAPLSEGAAGELCILGLGLAKEKATIVSEEPLRAVGLMHAMKAALDEADLTMFDIGYRLCDVNGEHYKFKEATFAFGRLLKQVKRGRFQIWHPIEHIGEIGAAIGPCVLAVALHAGQKNYAPGNPVLCHFSNDDEDRGAIVARYLTGEKDR